MDSDSDYDDDNDDDNDDDGDGHAAHRPGDGQLPPHVQARMSALADGH